MKLLGRVEFVVARLESSIQIDERIPSDSAPRDTRQRPTPPLVPTRQRSSPFAQLSIGRFVWEIKSFPRVLMITTTLRVVVRGIGCLGSSRRWTHELIGDGWRRRRRSELVLGRRDPGSGWRHVRESLIDGVAVVLVVLSSPGIRPLLRDDRVDGRSVDRSHSPFVIARVRWRDGDCRRFLRILSKRSLSVIARDEVSRGGGRSGTGLEVRIAVVMRLLHRGRRDGVEIEGIVRLA